jgi:hypothetical protein
MTTRPSIDELRQQLADLNNQIDRTLVYYEHRKKQLLRSEGGNRERWRTACRDDAHLKELGSRVEGLNAGAIRIGATLQTELVAQLLEELRAPAQPKSPADASWLNSARVAS